MIKELESCEAFTAMGFFNVDRSCLISLIANGLTYLVILLQGELLRKKAFVQKNNRTKRNWVGIGTILPNPMQSLSL